MVIGGTAGSFLGEYQAGGVIVVLGLEAKDKKIVGFSILGGEPLQQGQDMLNLVKEIKERYPDKTIWMWTGCVYEELTPEQLDIVKYVDVLIDGRFDIEHRTPRSRYKGSFNQRVIDVAKTLKANKCVLHELNYS